MTNSSSKTEVARSEEKDIRELQDKALETPGYSDDPHIESTNRSPKSDNNQKVSDDGEKQ